MNNLYDIKNGILYLTAEQLQKKGGINEASAYCNKSKECSVLMLPFGEHSIKYNLSIYSGTTLTATKGTILNLSPADSEKPAIDLIKIKRPYVENCTIENIDIRIHKECEAVIQTNRSHKVLIRNCFIEGNKLAKTGIRIGSKTEKGAIGSLLYNNRIVRTGIGVELVETGGKHRLDEMQIRFCNTGIEVARGMLVLENSELDHNDLHLDIKGDEGCFLSRCTLEQAGIKATNLKTFSMIDGKMSGGFIDLENVSYLELAKSKINGLKYISAGERVSIVGNYFQPPNIYSDLIDKYCDGKNIINGNHTGRGIKLKGCQ